MVASASSHDGVVYEGEEEVAFVVVTIANGHVERGESTLGLLLLLTP